jgi:DNA-binding NarL/FixJ family response regulator
MESHNAKFISHGWNTDETRMQKMPVRVSSVAKALRWEQEQVNMKSTKTVKKPKTKVFIVDDHPVVREGLAMMVARQPDLEVCGEAEDINAALRLTASAKPDVAIIDIALKNGNGLDLVKRLKARGDALRILVCSMYGERLYADRSLRAGALGYIMKEQATDLIIKAIRKVRQGKVFLSKPMAERLLKRAVGPSGDSLGRLAIEVLSDRELEVFRLLGNGLTTVQVALTMHVSTKTVETYQSRIKEKLDLESGRELLQRAAQWMSADD